MVGHEVGQLVEPPQGQLRQHRTLVGDRRVEDEVERRDPVRRHEQQLVVAAVRLIEVADLAGVDVREAGDLER